MKQLRRAALAIAALASFQSIAGANTVQDQQGVGSRVKAMGGAGTALAQDAAATYYNPAGLSQCARNQASIETNYWRYGLSVDSDTEEFEGEALSDRTAATFSACLHLPYRLSAGLLFDTGVSQVQSLKQSSLNKTPEYALYGKPLEQISIIGGISYKVDSHLSIGIGGAVLINSGLQIAAEIPVLGGDDEIAGAVDWELKPAASFYGGVRYEFDSQLVVAASLRTALFHQLKAETRTRVQAAGVLIDVDVLLENVAWYSPLQASIGATYPLSETITTAFDLSWYHYSAHPGPYIHISPLDPDDSVAAGLNYPPDEDLEFHDIVVPRFGVEFLPTSQLALRAGVSYRPTPAPLPAPDKRSNLLDASVATLSFGSGYSWQLKNSKDSQSISSFEISAHLRLHHMGEEKVTKIVDTNQTASFKFGGQMLYTGITATVGW